MIQKLCLMLDAVWPFRPAIIPLAIEVLSIKYSAASCRLVLAAAQAMLLLSRPCCCCPSHADVAQAMLLLLLLACLPAAAAAAPAAVMILCMFVQCRVVTLLSRLRLP